MSEITTIGIDLGTTYSCVAVYKNGKYDVISNTMDKKTTPSYVAFTNTDIIVGEEAKDQRIINAENTVYDVKRLIGRRFDDESVISDAKHWPYTVIEENSKIKIKVNHENIEKTFFPEEISAMVLIYLKRVAENFLGVPVKHAVITVPAYFNNSQREATKLAGEIAGLVVLRILNEPTAAALVYCQNLKMAESKTVMIYDFGGGTFDVSIIKIDSRIVEVLYTDGANQLGGKDIDNNLVLHLLMKLKNQHGDEMKIDRSDIVRITSKCEKLKLALSSGKTAYFELECLSNGLKIYETMSRETFESLNDTIFRTTLAVVDRCLSAAKLNKSDIDEIVLVGGSSRIPKIQEMLQTHFDGKRLCRAINPDESVAIGAAILADRITESTQFADYIADVTSKSLGISVKNYSSADNYQNLHDIIVKKNTFIPTKICKIYPTSEDNQTSIRIDVYEGEKRLSKDNYLLGKFDVLGLTPAPKGKTSCTVTFAIDKNGIITVNANETGTDNSNEITITRSDIWSTQDKNRMIAAAKKYHP